MSAGTDLVVHNDVSEMTADRHPATIYRGDDVVATTDDNASLAGGSRTRALLDIVR